MKFPNIERHLEKRYGIGKVQFIIKPSTSKDPVCIYIYGLMFFGYKFKYKGKWYGNWFGVSELLKDDPQGKLAKHYIKVLGENFLYVRKMVLLGRVNELEEGVCPEPIIICEKE